MKKVKRVLALVMVILLAGLYIATIVTACFVTPQATQMFKTSVIATIMVPIMMYVVLFLYRLIHKEDTEEKEHEEA